MNQQAKDVICQWANLHTQAHGGWTALHFSCKQSVKMFLYLAEEIGADLSAKTNKGITIMHKAAYDNNSYILTYLKDKHDFSIMELDEDLNTPLHFACD